MSGDFINIQAARECNSTLDVLGLFAIENQGQLLLDEFVGRRACLEDVRACYTLGLHEL